MFPLPLANLLFPAHKAENFLNYPEVNLRGSLKTYQFTTSLHGGMVIPPLYVKKLAFGSSYPDKTSLKFNTNYLEVLLLLISLLLYKSHYSKKGFSPAALSTSKKIDNTANFLSESFSNSGKI